MFVSFVTKENVAQNSGVLLFQCLQVASSLSASSSPITFVNILFDAKLIFAD